MLQYQGGVPMLGKDEKKKKKRKEIEERTLRENNITASLSF